MTKIPLLINNRIFISKSEAHKYFSNMLNNYYIGSTISENEKKDLLSLISYYEHSSQKIGVGVSSVSIESNLFGVKCFILHRVDGSVTDVSYIKCLNKPTLNYKIRMACRTAIKQQIFDFKNYREGHVHHTIVPFSVIVADWLCGVTVSVSDLNETIDNEYQIYFVNSVLVDSFRTFHKDRAVLILLSEEEHKNIHKGVVDDS